MMDFHTMTGEEIKTEILRIKAQIAECTEILALAELAQRLKWVIGHYTNLGHYNL